MIGERIHRRFGAVCIAGLLILAGCGGEISRNLPKAPVSGTVSYAKPFPEGEVIFRHVSGEITVAKFEDDGAYEAMVPEGSNSIAVRSLTSSLAEGRPGTQMETYKNNLPVRYGDFNTSKLQLNVVDGENHFDMKLTD